MQEQKLAFYHPEDPYDLALEKSLKSIKEGFAVQKSLIGRGLRLARKKRKLDLILGYIDETAAVFFLLPKPLVFFAMAIPKQVANFGQPIATEFPMEFTVNSYGVTVTNASRRLIDFLGTNYPEIAGLPIRIFGSLKDYHEQQPLVRVYRNGIRYKKDPNLKLI